MGLRDDFVSETSVEEPIVMSLLHDVATFQFFQRYQSLLQRLELAQIEFGDETEAFARLTNEKREKIIQVWPGATRAERLKAIGPNEGDREATFQSILEADMDWVRNRERVTRAQVEVRKLKMQIDVMLELRRLSQIELEREQLTRTAVS